MSFKFIFTLRVFIIIEKKNNLTTIKQYLTIFFFKKETLIKSNHSNWFFYIISKNVFSVTVIYVVTNNCKICLNSSD